MSGRIKKGGAKVGWFDAVRTENAKEAVEELLQAKDEEQLEEWKRKYGDHKEDDNTYTWFK